jgi:hypothetical protein
MAASVLEAVTDHEARRDGGDDHEQVPDHMRVDGYHVRVTALVPHLVD